MRIFDTYTFNVIDRVKFKDTKKYVDNMMSDLGLTYDNVGFGLSYGPVDEAVEKFPNLEKYSCWEDENNKSLPHAFSQRMITSYSKNWTKGQVYAEREDWDEIFELFTKIPRPFKFGFSSLILCGVNWFDDSDAALSIEKNCRENMALSGARYFACNRIGLFRGYDFGRTYNPVSLMVETTSNSEPRDTSEILRKLEPYLGEPETKYRECWFSDDDLERRKNLQEKYNDKITQLFLNMVGECQYKYSDIPNEPIILKLCDKRTINNAFKGTGFAVGSHAGLLPGMNEVLCTDDNNFKYSILFDRSPSGNWFSFHIHISSYNFELELSQKNFGAKSKEEATAKVNEIAKFVVSVRDEIGKEAAAAFGKCPQWYLEFNEE